LGTRPEGAEEEEGVKKRVYPKLDHDRLVMRKQFIDAIVKTFLD
jgi:hypothetical protein